MSQERTVRLLELLDGGETRSVSEIRAHFPEYASDVMLPTLYSWLYRLAAAGFLEKVIIPAEGGTIGRPAITGYRSLWKRRQI